MNLAVNGEVTEPHSDLGEHINECWGDLNGPSERSLVHWIRRLVFRGAWLDQRVMEGELEVVFDDATTRSATPSPTATTSSSSSRPSRPGAGSRTAARRAPART